MEQITSKINDLKSWFSLIISRSFCGSGIQPSSSNPGCLMSLRSNGGWDWGHFESCFTLMSDDGLGWLDQGSVEGRAPRASFSISRWSSHADFPAWASYMWAQGFQGACPKRENTRQKVFCFLIPVSGSQAASHLGLLRIKGKEYRPHL